MSFTDLPDLGQQVLNLVHLGRAIAAGVNGDDLNALLAGIGIDGLLDLVEEVGLQVGNGKADAVHLLVLRAGRAGQKAERHGGHELRLE